MVRQAVGTCGGNPQGDSQESIVHLERPGLHGAQHVFSLQMRATKVRNAVTQKRGRKTCTLASLLSGYSPLLPGALPLPIQPESEDKAVPLM